MSFGLARGRTLDTGGIGIESRDLPPYDDGRIDPRLWFDNPSQPLEMEVGTGKGTFLLREAADRPDVNFLGIEWAGEFYRYAADRLRRHDCSNTRILRDDATEFLQFRCDDAVAQVIHLYFSDPWPKKRHHKRRVVQDETMRQFHRILTDGGELRLVTDHDDLWTWCEEHMERSADLFHRVAFTAPDGGELVGTNFERKYRREGRPFHAATLVKIS